MKTILAKGWFPTEVGIPTEDVNEQTVREYCIRCAEYKTESGALSAYAECRATWSTLLDTDDDIEQFIKTAASKIINRDYNWLEKHFV